MQVFASLKLDLSSKVQLSEDLRKVIAASKARPTKPVRDPMPYVMCAASVACSVLGVFEDNPALSSPAVKIYTYVYLVLSLLF